MMIHPATADAEPDIAALRDAAAGWLFFHDLFRFPTDAQWTWLLQPAIAAAWNLLATHLDAGAPLALPLPDSRSEYEETFLSTFEVGLPVPLCPLSEAYWCRSQPTPKVLHENMLFYRQFGLVLRPAAVETADHLRHQSEFMHYLYRQEAEWRGQPERTAMAESCARGRSDFLARHLLTWLPPAAAQLRQRRPATWPTHWLALLAAFAAQPGRTEAVPGSADSSMPGR